MLYRIQSVEDKVAGKIAGPGGTRKGRPNRRSQGLLAQIKKQFPNYDPIMHMASVAADESQDQSTRLAASKEISQYVYPKLKAIEVSGGDEPIHHVVSASPLTLEEWEAQQKQNESK